VKAVGLIEVAALPKRRAAVSFSPVRIGADQSGGRHDATLHD
jgi:hypothetical protein